MRVSEIMSRCVAVCTEDTGLEEVYEFIRKGEHNLVVVIDSNAHRVPIGVATERSICDQIIARGRNPRTLSAGSVMDSRIKRVSENQLLENIEADELEKLTAMIVVNNDREIVGVVPRETIGRFGGTTAKSPAVTVTVNPAPAPATPRRVSEIPAFGWIQ